jgi:Ca-activated chloride channel family protein
MSILAALVLTVAACGSGDDADDAAGQTSSESAGGSTDDGDGDGEERADDAAEALDAADDEDAEAGFGQLAGADEGAAPATTTAQSREADRGGADAAADAATGEAANGGFFAPEPPQDDTTAEFADYGVRPFVETDRDPTSTFALDVDTGSYALARRWLESGSIPPPEAVRVEEFVNSFRYEYRAPSDGLAVQADAGPSPFDADNVIVRLGVQAERVANAERPDAALTFVVDTSGSMDRVDRLGLVKTALTRLVGELDGGDTVSIVTYSDEARVLLEPTPVSRRGEIVDAIDALRPTGSTNLEAGLRRGYELAEADQRRGGINRVVLASDGIANVGLTDPDGLSRLIRGSADRGIQLVTVGVGMGGFNDELMEQLADRGDGFYAYVDDVAEAERLFGDELVSTLLTVAIDGKIQVEFDADTVARYRLIGFENRAVLDDDFRNDAVDAGELGAGHQVTALYELTLRPGVDRDRDRSLGTVRLRWEDPDDRSVDETSLPLDLTMVTERWDRTDRDFRLAVTVAAWAELLRNSPHVGDVTMDQVLAEAESLSTGTGAVAELTELIAISR